MWIWLMQVVETRQVQNLVNTDNIKRLILVSGPKPSGATHVHFVDGTDIAVEENIHDIAAKLAKSESVEDKK